VHFKLVILFFKKAGDFSPTNYFLGFGVGGLFPLPPPDGFPVVLGALTGLGFDVLDIVASFF
jgi:hypothetical protein